MKRRSFLALLGLAPVAPEVVRSALVRPGATGWTQSPSMFASTILTERGIVAVSPYGEIATSQDGATWETHVKEHMQVLKSWRDRE